MTAGCLPEELMMDILTRLPVKSLVRFECIHKSWNSLIKSFDFVITHSQNPKNRTHGSIFVAYYDHDSGNMFFRSLAPNSFDVRADLVIPSIIKQQYMIRSSCNGLLCLCNYDPCRILLYNPCLNQYKILPTSNLYHMTLSELFGFGYDSTNNDYKVVRELLSWDWEQVPRRITEVYSLRRNSWRKLGSNIIPDDIRLCGGIGFVSDSLFNGAIHRLAYYSRNNNRAGMIVSFDVCNEEFHMFSRPNLKGCNADLKISVNRDLLSIFDLAFQVRDEVCCDIWVMKEYGVEDSWYEDVSDDDEEGRGYSLPGPDLPSRYRVTNYEAIKTIVLAASDKALYPVPLCSKGGASLL
ncbi:hypothetical protein COLO4_23769 [Corchorus olitorius]|uniref:F-box domain-containing protein n=1 Tax=Corchorus olitorius TaxID=93759 RepID=A0A1R3IET4_9ROSI|nr:hypothetical protein COLO4_23769 [Corchorus olitorius]